MVRPCEELVDYFSRYNEVPETTSLLAGTSLIPPNEVTFREDHTFVVDLEYIRTLDDLVERL
jgi:hypothetical protein